MTPREEKSSKASVKGPFLFIVNPNSGTGAVNLFRKSIELVTTKKAFTVVESQSPAHSLELAQTASKKGFEAVIAVGGDGSVHEIASELIGSNVALGIIPTGSGNGISRHLKISNKVETAIDQMLRGNVKTFDTFTVNGVPAIGFAGLGIDAQVAKVFSEATERGFSNYVKLSIDAMTKYKPTNFKIQVPEERELINAYSIVCANTNQFGNNAYINPQAIDNDGQLELIVINSMPKSMLMPLASRLFLKSIHKSKYVKTYKGSRFEVENMDEAHLQIDGEAIGTFNKLIFEVNPNSLMVITP